MKTVLIADNQDITKAGIHYLVNALHDNLLVLEVTTKKELIDMLEKRSELMVVLDYTNFDFSGVDELIHLSMRFKPVHWILFSEDLTTDFITRICYETYHFSLLFKDASKEEINAALMLAHKNERYICNRATHQLLGKRNPSDLKPDKSLTQAETDILRQIALGKSTKEIAQERFSSIHTITTHRKNIFKKLEVNSIYEATRYALRAGIIDSAEYYI